MRVVIESPFAGRGGNFLTRWWDARQNLRYLRRCLRDSLMRGEAPFASHAIYTQPGVLRDHLKAERKHGIDAGFMWREVAEMTVVYVDRRVTEGMKLGILHARKHDLPVAYRALSADYDGFAMYLGLMEQKVRDDAEEAA